MYGLHLSFPPALFQILVWRAELQFSLEGENVLPVSQVGSDLHTTLPHQRLFQNLCEENQAVFQKSENT